MNKYLKIILKSFFYATVFIGAIVVVGYKYLTYQNENNPEILANRLHEESYKPIHIEFSKIRNVILHRKTISYIELTNIIDDQLPKQVETKHMISLNWQDFWDRWVGINNGYEITKYH